MDNLYLLKKVLAIELALEVTFNPKERDEIAWVIDKTYEEWFEDGANSKE